MNREAGEHIHGNKGEIHKRTGVSNTRFRQKMRMKVDVLYATEEILSIEYEDEQWRLVAYLSKSLNKIE